MTLSNSTSPRLITKVMKVTKNTKNFVVFVIFVSFVVKPWAVRLN